MTTICIIKIFKSIEHFDVATIFVIFSFLNNSKKSSLVASANVYEYNTPDTKHTHTNTYTKTKMKF